MGMFHVKQKRPKGRTKPYADRGISRVPCLRCGKPSSWQWRCCALGGKYFGMCDDCDVKLNGLLMRFFGIDKSVIKRYKKKMKGDKHGKSKDH